METRYLPPLDRCFSAGVAQRCDDDPMGTTEMVSNNACMEYERFIEIHPEGMMRQVKALAEDTRLPAASPQHLLIPR